MSRDRRTPMAAKRFAAFRAWRWLILSAVLACATPSRAGVIVLSGDDADQHCTGTRCAALYPRLLRAAADSSGVRTDTLLAIGATGAAQTALAGWNLPTSGGPGLVIRYALTVQEILSADFSNYRVLYLPTRQGEISGGVTQAQIDALSLRRGDLADYVNRQKGSLIALHLGGLTNAYAWLPIPIEVVVRSATAVEPTDDLRRIVPGISTTDLSHSEYHSQFTGPPGLSGLKPLAFATATMQPVLIGSEMANVTAGPVCTVSPGRSIQVAPGDSAFLTVRAADPRGGTVTLNGIGLPSFVTSAPGLPASGSAAGLTARLRIAPLPSHAGQHSFLLFATGSDGASSPPCTLSIAVTGQFRRLRARPTRIRWNGLAGGDSAIVRELLVLGVRSGDDLSLTASDPWLNAELVEQSSSDARVRVTVRPDRLSPGPHDGSIAVARAGDANVANVPVRIELGSPIDLARCELPWGAMATPRGSMTYHVRLRTTDGIPVAGAGGEDVWMDLAAIDGMRDCSGGFRMERVEPLQKSKSDGVVRFTIPAVGIPRGVALLRTRNGQSRMIRLASLDRNADGRLTARDFSYEGSPDFDGNGVADLADWQILRSRIGESCREGGPIVSLRTWVSDPRKPLYSGDTVLVCGSVTNVTQRTVRLDSLVLTAKAFGIGGTWIALARETGVVLEPGETHTTATDYRYPLASSHSCFRTVAYGTQDASPIGLSGTPFWRVVDEDSVRRCEIGIGTTVVAALPYDPSTSIANWSEFELLGKPAAEIVDWDASSRAEFDAVLRSSESDTLFYLWKNGLLHSGGSAEEDTLLSRVAAFLAQLKYSIPDPNRAAAAASPAASFATGSLTAAVAGNPDCVAPACIPCHKNGCGPDPLRGIAYDWANWLGSLLLPEFRECCNAHDCCYHGVPAVGGTATGCDPVKDRGVCDETWRICMFATCAAQSFSTTPSQTMNCLIKAQIAHDIVSSMFKPMFNQDCSNPPEHIVRWWRSKQLNTIVRAETRPAGGNTTRTATSAALHEEDNSAGPLVVPVFVDSAGAWRIELASMLPAGYHARLAGAASDGSVTVQDSANLMVELRADDASAPAAAGSILLVAFDRNGEYAGDAEIQVGTPDPVIVDHGVPVQVGPNPFRDDCTIGFRALDQRPFEVDVFGIDGRRVRRLATGPGTGAWMQVHWDGRSGTGQTAPAGVYFVRVRSGNSTFTRVVTKLR